VYKILALRDASTALHALGLLRLGIEAQLLKKILYYICSHNTHIQQLVISVNNDSNLIMSSVSSCRALTFLNLYGYHKSCDGFKKKVIFKISEFLCTDQLGSS
jgi:hypothetical protein